MARFKAHHPRSIKATARRVLKKATTVKAPRKRK